MPQYQLDNLVAIVDHNKIQSFGSVADVLDLTPLAEKWRAFRWAVREIDGHDHVQIATALAAAPFEAGKPTVVIAHTVKGKGVSFMEGYLAWHYRSPDAGLLAQALTELEVRPMRAAFIETMLDLAEHEERIWLLCGDLGYSVLERFAERFPGRFVNVGVAEQNMTGVAAGLALSGKIVFTYSIANFPIMRCLEQIRNDICYHDLNVKIVAVGGGFAYGSAGYSHHALEDLVIMRSLPNMTVLAPGDPTEARLAIRAVLSHTGPCYMRFGKAGEPTVHPTEPHFEIGHVIPMRSGTDALVVSTGGMCTLH